MLVVGLIHTNFTGSEMDEKYKVYYIGTAPPAHSAEYINARQTTTLYYIHFLRTVITCAYLNAYICSYSNASTIFGYVCGFSDVYDIYIYILYAIRSRDGDMNGALRVRVRKKKEDRLESVRC